MSDILAMQTYSKCVLHVVINYKELQNVEMVMLTCVYFLGACSPWILTLTEDPGEVPTAGTLPHRYDKVTIFFSLSFNFPFIYRKMCLY